ncbi:MULTISPECIES: hypothetical protein [Streptomyces]|uniref:Tail assembly chaperone n=1 Tax=Streptomyces apricus TaxID=1828112 RepID=A0A5B0BKM6_9ACTN|nr:hypothetical protein [Streptomyces apricus]KAA0941842.1 hypothetical protein FGF04_04605 [Streptomyces apricus]
MTERDLRHRGDEYDEPDFDEEPEDEVDDLELDADFTGADLAKRETTKQPYRFRGPDGTVFSVPHPDLWSVRGQSALEGGDIPTWAMEVFDQDMELVQSFLDMPMGVFRPVMTKITQIANETSRAGMNRGERRASARMSRSTPKNSKRR